MFSLHDALIHMRFHIGDGHVSSVGHSSRGSHYFRYGRCWAASYFVLNKHMSMQASEGMKDNTQNFMKATQVQPKEVDKGGAWHLQDVPKYAWRDPTSECAGFAGRLCIISYHEARHKDTHWENYCLAHFSKTVVHSCSWWQLSLHFLTLCRFHALIYWNTKPTSNVNC